MNVPYATSPTPSQSDLPAPATIPRVARPRLHDTVVEHLRRFIVEGVLAAGSKLNERELCETLGISRTPLREAFKVLCAEGLIDILPNRGAVVATLSETEVRDMFELMGALEAFSGELACARITATEVANIKLLHAAMLVCRQNNDLAGYYRRNQAIHDQINLAARNAALRQTYLSVNRRLQALRFRSNFQTPNWDRAIADHQAMLAALDARDGSRLAALLRTHLREKCAAVLAAI